MTQSHFRHAFLSNYLYNQLLGGKFCKSKKKKTKKKIIFVINYRFILDLIFSVLTFWRQGPKFPPKQHKASPLGPPTIEVASVIHWEGGPHAGSLYQTYLPFIDFIDALETGLLPTNVKISPSYITRDRDKANLQEISSFFISPPLRKATRCNQ